MSIKARQVAFFHKDQDGGHTTETTDYIVNIIHREIFDVLVCNLIHLEKNKAALNTPSVVKIWSMVSTLLKFKLQ